MALLVEVEEVVAAVVVVVEVAEVVFEVASSLVAFVAQ